MRLRKKATDARRSLYADDYVTKGEREYLGDEEASALAMDRRIALGVGQPSYAPGPDDVGQDREDALAGRGSAADVYEEVWAWRQAVMDGRALPFRDEAGQ